jgi:hypothetical protein
MDANEELAQWAALFVGACVDREPGPDQVGESLATPVVRYAGVTPAASMLLQSIDAGGVPAFVTSNLKQIAVDNGIDVTDQWTPNEIVDALRRKVEEGESPC